MSVLKHMRGHIIRHRTLSISTFLVSVVVQLLHGFNPLATGWMLSALEQSKPFGDFLYIVLWAGILFVLLAIFERIFYRFYGFYWNILEVDLNNTYRKKLLLLDHCLIVDKGTGRIGTMQTRGINAEIEMFITILEIVCVVIPRFIIALVIIGFMASWVTAILIICTALVVRGAIRIHKYVIFYRKKVDTAWEKTNRITTKVVMEYQTVFLHNMQSYEQTLASNYSKPIIRRGTITDGLNNIPYVLLHLCLIGIELSLYIVLGYFVLTYQTYSISQIVVLVSFLYMLRRPISIMMQKFSQRNKNVSAYNRRQTFINTPPTIIDGPKQFVYHKGVIEFDQISFAYPQKKQKKQKNKISGEAKEISIKQNADNPHVKSVSSVCLFNHFSLTIPAGQTTALVGHSGSGKSTLVKLLLRLYDISKGAIMIDGQSLTDIQRASRYDHVGYVSQEPAVFDGSIRENLSYGLKTPASDEQLRASLKAVHLAEIISQKPTGLKTHLGERGIKLSGGERQRLALARLILRDPEIIILDEPTSALDSISESAITQILKSRAGRKTIIVIAHRLQTVMHADQIIVLDHGTVVQQGNHIELISQEGIYKTLVDLQKGEISE